MTNTWDAANRLVSVSQPNAALVNHYDGLGNRAARTQDGQRVNYTLDVAAGLPEVVYSSNGNKYLHLPGVIVTENAAGEVRYLLSDGLGSIRHATGMNGAVVAYHEYAPYGQPLADSEDSYGFTGEWWQADIGLLHLRARWYEPASGTFLSRDPVESEPPYQYVRGNTINLTDPSGLQPPPCTETTNPLDLCYTPPIELPPTYGPVPAPEGMIKSESHLFDIDCDGTVSFSVGGSASFFGPEVGVYIDIFHVDEQGNIVMGTLTTNPVGGSTTIGGSASASLLFTNGENLGELQGSFINTGPGLGDGTGGGLDKVVGGKGKNGIVHGWSPYVWAGPKIANPFILPPIYYHGGHNYTYDTAILTYRADVQELCILNGCTLSSFSKPYTPSTGFLDSLRDAIADTLLRLWEDKPILPHPHEFWEDY